MVRKLLKHEFLFYWRLILPVHIALLGVALLGRFTQLFEADTVVYDVVSTSAVVLFVVAALASLLLTTIFCIIRFYRNLFSGEGYLTFTLPVTPTQHLLVKLLAAVVINLLSLLGVFVSTCVILDTDMLLEIGKALIFLYKEVGEALGANRIHLTLYLVEMPILTVVSRFYQILVFYLCIALGQLFHKNRILIAVGMFFAYFLITQIIATVLSGALSIYLSNFRSIIELLTFIGKHPYASIHIVFGVSMAIYVGMAILFFFLTRRIIRRKLNLE